MQEMEVNADRYMAKAVGVSNSLRGVHENISSIHKWLSAPGDQEEFEMGMEVLNDFINDLSILGKDINTSFLAVHREYQKPVSYTHLTLPTKA